MTEPPTPYRPANDEPTLLSWYIDGPDESGKVWLFDTSGKEGKYLGDYEAVAPYLQSWLDANARVKS